MILVLENYNSIYGQFICNSLQSVGIILVLYIIDRKYPIKHRRFFIVTKYKRDMGEVLVWEIFLKISESY